MVAMEPPPLYKDTSFKEDDVQESGYLDINRTKIPHEMQTPRYSGHLGYPKLPRSISID